MKGEKGDDPENIESLKKQIYQLTVVVKELIKAQTLPLVHNMLRVEIDSTD